MGIIQNGIAGCNFTSGALLAVCIPNFIAHLIQFIFTLLGMFFVANVMFAGYQIAIGGISPGEKDNGKRRLMWSIIGLIVSICSFVILDLIISVVTDRL